jgi:DNA-binding XRE family transcriptional regulator
MTLKKVGFVKRRKELRLTQLQVANAIGVSPRTVQRWELGESLPELTVLQTFRLCELLRCSIRELAADFYPGAFSEKSVELSGDTP